MAEAGRIPVGAPARPEPIWYQLAVSAGMALVLGLMLLGGYRLVVDHLRHTKPGRVAGAMVRNAPQLRALLGDGFRQKLEAGETGDDGTAQFTFTVQGPKGTADVEIALHKEGSNWRFSEGTIETEEGVIPLEAPAPPERSAEPQPAPH